MGIFFLEYIFLGEILILRGSYKVDRFGGIEVVVKGGVFGVGEW